jgi:hypothetical protein
MQAALPYSHSFNKVIIDGYQILKQYNSRETLYMKAFQRFFGETIVFSTKLNKEALTLRLREITSKKSFWSFSDAKQFNGRVDEGGFQVRPNLGYRNSFSPTSCPH